MFTGPRNSWRRAGIGRRVVVALGFFALVCVAVAVCALGYFLRPADSIEDYAAHYRDDTGPRQQGEVAVTFFGVSTLLFEDGESSFLIDAFFSRPSVLESLTRVHSDVPGVGAMVSAFGMEELDAVFVAHSHHDHALDVASVANITGARVYGTESTRNVGRGGGVPEGQLLLVESGSTVEVGDFTVRVLSSPHSQVPGAPESPEVPAIDRPLVLPATLGSFAEGGNFNFVVTHGERTYVVVASANFAEGALEGIDADVLFLGTALVGMQDAHFQRRYIEQTLGATGPSVVVPLHWDDFLKPWVRGKARFNPRLIDAKPALGFDLVIEGTTTIGAKFIVLQAGSRLRVPG